MLKIVKNYPITSDGWDSFVVKSPTATFFQTYAWLNLFKKHFAKHYLELAVFENNHLICLTSFSLNHNHKIYLLGTQPVLDKQLVTDYGDFIFLQGRENIALKELLNYLKENFKNHQLILSFIRKYSITYSLLTSLKFVKKEVDLSPQIKLPDAWNDYLRQLNAKNRHELKRKINRFEKAGVKIIWPENINAQVIDDFFSLMASSAKAKNSFLTEAMKDYFKDIFKTLANNIIVGFAQLGEIKIASVLAFKYQKNILLYNSGFLPVYGRLSPGLILKANLIKKAIELHCTTYDFLRGGERYKFELGAQGVRLYEFCLDL